jgi:hypothetical protein
VRARLEAVRADYEEHLVHVTELQRAGTVLVAGTDAGISLTKRHGLVPMEVAGLVACGLPAAARSPRPPASLPRCAGGRRAPAASRWAWTPTC